MGNIAFDVKDFSKSGILKLNQQGETMPKIKFWSLILVLLMAAGCALPRFPGDPFSSAPKPAVNSKYATIYFYRYGVNTPIKNGIIKMYVDNISAFNAANSSFTWIFVKPGIHDLKASWVWHSKPVLAGGFFDNDDKSLSINLEAGKTYYFNYRTTPGYGSIGNQENIFIVSAELEYTSADVALKEMEQCGYLSNSYKP